MLGELERKLTAIVGDGVATRTHMQVVQAPAAPQPQPGGDVVRVGLTAVTPQPVFERGQIEFGSGAGGPTSRRVLPLQFTAAIEFRLRVAGNNPTNLSDARALLLDDMSIVSHSLATSGLRNGSAFATAAPDPGFTVFGFELTGGTTASTLEDNTLTGALLYGGAAEIWPPGPASGVGVMGRIDTVIAALPITIAADVAAVVAGSTATLRVRGVGGTRLAETANGRTPLQLAVSVLSDLPPAQRGTITSGVAGAATDVRIVPLGEDETLLAYRAPAGDLGTTRLEVIAVHLATPDRRQGVFLGTAPVQLLPENP